MLNNLGTNTFHRRFERAVYPLTLWLVPGNQTRFAGTLLTVT